tara:strand:+ start:392 stop:1474 length:1083 start_codon:yes stop_codon:yes gene_type:complete
MEKIGPNNIVFDTNRVNKTFEVSSSNKDFHTVSFFISSSANVQSAPLYQEPTEESSYWNTLNHLFYRPNYQPIVNYSRVENYSRYGSNPIWPNEKKWISDPVSYGVLHQFNDDLPNPQHKNKFGKHGVVLSISSSKYGIGIKPGSFKYHDISTDEFNLRDDGYGNLYDINPTTTSDSYIDADGSLSSSANYVGNIFYEYGIITITETGSFKAPASTAKYYISGGTNYSMSFDSSLDIYSYDYYCTIPGHLYNWTSNPTIFSSTGSTITVNDKDFDAAHYLYADDNYVTQSTTNIKGVFGGERALIRHEVQHLENKWNPYISKIGLYNSKGDLIMYASLPQPIKKIKTEDLTIKVQMDFQT